jgi:hypothetical protein
VFVGLTPLYRTIKLSSNFVCVKITEYFQCVFTSDVAEMAYIYCLALYHVHQKSPLLIIICLFHYSFFDDSVRRPL